MFRMFDYLKEHFLHSSTALSCISTSYCNYCDVLLLYYVRAQSLQPSRQLAAKWHTSAPALAIVPRNQESWLRETTLAVIIRDFPSITVARCL